jgi:hypothetical protein
MGFPISDDVEINVMDSVFEPENGWRLVQLISGGNID